MRRDHLFVIFFLVLFSNCITIKTAKIGYNANKRFYEYALSKKNPVVLRNDSNLLVDNNNYVAFINEMERINFRYPFRKRLENNIALKNSDLELTKWYSMINENIMNKHYDMSLFYISKLKSMFPDVDKYSDFYFLEGYTYEKLQSPEAAKKKYDLFLKNSSQKYSTRFRGYRDFDQNDSIFIKERRYALHFLNNNSLTFDTNNFKAILPKYYFGSFRPGYTFNQEDYSKSTKIVPMFYITMDDEFVPYLGIQFFYHLDEMFNFNPTLIYSPDLVLFNIATPIQVYKSQNNRLGLKLSPFIDIFSIDSITIIGQKYPVHEDIINFGGRMSAGLYLFPRFSLGAYYQFNYYNENNKYLSKKSQFDIWKNNEYEINCFYNINKIFSMKTGLRNDGIVIGIMIQFFELSFNILQPAPILKTVMY